MRNPKELRRCDINPYTRTAETSVKIASGEWVPLRIQHQSGSVVTGLIRPTDYFKLYHTVDEALAVLQRGDAWR